MRRADRLFRLVQILRRRKLCRACDLAEELEVSRRTILRDVEALNIAGVPIYTEPGFQGGISIDPDYRTNLTGLTEAEIQSLFISQSTAIWDKLGLGDAMRSTQLKLQASLPKRHSANATNIQQRVYLDPEWWFRSKDNNPDYFADIQHAVYHDLQLRMSYEKKNGDVTERVVNPLGLVAKTSEWYLVAVHAGDQFRSYRLSRFRSVTLLDTSFVRDPSFVLSEFWDAHTRQFENSFEILTFGVRAPRRLLNLFRMYADGRYTIVARDGNMMTVEVSLGDIPGARMFVLGLGAEAEVLYPEDLRQAVYDYADAIAAKYKTGDPS